MVTRSEGIAVGSGPAFSMGRRTSASSLAQQADEPLPGPGAYEVPTSFQSGPSFTLKGRPRERPQEELPGPGAYRSSALERCAQSPAFISITSSGLTWVLVVFRSPVIFCFFFNLYPSSLSPLPSPTVSTLGAGPSYTMLGKPPEMVEDLPGPGEYNLKRDVNTGAEKREADDASCKV